MKVYIPSLALENDVELAREEDDMELMQSIACPNALGVFANREDALTALREKIENEVVEYYECEEAKPHCKSVDDSMFRVFLGEDCVGVAFVEEYDFIQ